MKKQKSFTLIEILVVIAIIGLLASITLVAIKETRKKAYIARALNYSAQVHHAIGAYLVAEYRFEGNLDDTSGSDHHGTWEGIGDPPYVTDVVPEIGGEALEFGSNDYVSIGNIPALAGKNVTIVAWVKWAGTTINNYNPIVTQYDGVIYEGYFFYITRDDELALWLTTGGEATVSPPAGFADGWHFVAGTYDGAWLAVYIDGVLKDIDHIEATGVDMPAYIGYSLEGGAEDYFNGVIDDVRIYEEAFTSAQIKKLYAEGVKRHPTITMNDDDDNI